MKKIILASASPRRRDLMERLDLEFEVVICDADEVTDKTEPEDVVIDLASRKAMRVFGDQKEDAIVIGADTIVYNDGKILGKPVDDKECFGMLTSLSGKTHQVYTGVCVIYSEDDKVNKKTWAVKTDVSVYPLSSDEIMDYIAAENPFDKAGGYGIQEPYAKCREEIREE